MAQKNPNRLGTPLHQASDGKAALAMMLGEHKLLRHFTQLVSCGDSRLCLASNFR